MLMRVGAAVLLGILCTGCDQAQIPMWYSQNTPEWFTTGSDGQILYHPNAAASAIDAQRRARNAAEVAEDTANWDAYKAAHPKLAAETIAIHRHNNEVGRCRGSYAMYGGSYAALGPQLGAMVATDDAASASTYATCGQTMVPPYWGRLPPGAG